VRCTESTCKAAYSGLVATVEERLATLEQIARDNQRDIREILGAVNGGEGIEWVRSVRGRLHTIEQYVNSARLGQAYRQRSWSLWVQAVVAAAAVAAGAAPYVILLAH
jgi:hypothetical protein